MAVLTFVHYKPKPSKICLQESSSKSTKNLATDSNSVPVEALPALEGVAGKNICFQKVAGDDVAIVQDVQACRGGLAGTQEALIGEKDCFNIDIDDEFPFLARVVSSNYKLALAEERPSVESTAGTDNDQILEDSLLESRESQAGSTHNEPIVFHIDEEIEDDNDFGPGNTHYIVESRQPDHDTLDIEHKPMPSARTIHEHRDSGNCIEKATSYQTIKRRRSNASPSISRHSTTSPPPSNEDTKGSKELVNDSDLDESNDDNICCKRRKVSTPQGYRIVCRDSPSQLSPSVSDDEEGSEENDGTLSIPLDARPTKCSISTPASEVNSPIEFEVCPVVTDIDQDWDVREIIGKEDFDGVLYYLVDWHPTLLPGHSLGHAKELVDAFEARIRAQREVNNKRSGLGSKTKQKANVEGKALSGQQGKKPRGRPRKRT